MKKRTALLFLSLIFAGLISFFNPDVLVNAQSETADNLINAVNDLRSSRGLAPYQVDSGLMTYAQQHADYMASIQSATHDHSDGTVAWESGIQENVASGTDGLITAAFVVNQIWSDYIHLRVMVDYATGNVGAGVALGGDGNLYFVLNVVPGESVAISNPISAADSVVPTTTAVATSGSEWIVPLVESTPNAEGEVIHIVGNGQSLWDIAIAYEVKIDDIRALNFIPTDSTVINVGQELLIMRVTVQPTVPEATATPMPTRTIFQPSPTATSPINETEEISEEVVGISTPTVIPNAPEKENSFNIVTVVITVLLIGLLFFSYFGFIQVKENPSEESKETKQ